MGAYINSVVTNMQSMFTQRQLGITSKQREKSTEKLSSGYRINRAADDAAGLTISENMRRMIRGLTQASANVQDGVSLCQVADGYLTEVHDMLHRLDELTIKASNGTLKDEDRASIDGEVSALKKEMKRIFKEANFNGIPLFHVPYTPDITGNLQDMKVFHKDNGSIGGLEFYNIRYNIAELQDAGLKIDNAGIATENFNVKFNLYNGEEVDITMKEGDNLNAVSRNCKWTADDAGIYINGILSAQWNEVRDDAGNGIDISGTVPTGTYTFTHHGMTISFDIDEEAEPEEVLTGINGDLATKAASWDVTTGGATSPKAADIYKTNSTRDRNAQQTIRVTSSNKSYIDGTYSIIADANGLAVKCVDRSGTEHKTSYVGWNTFKDSSLASIPDSNGNPIDTNGGYPIKNWGDNNDGNSASEITFDGDARYHFTSPDSNVKIEFDFSLAESASLTEVMNALNNVTIATPSVYAPGKLTGSGTSYGTVTPGNSLSLASNFTTQRAYGRTFTSEHDELTADITVERSVSGRLLEDDDTTTVSGTYAVSGHSLTDRRQTGHDLASTSSPSSQTYEYYYTTEYYDDFKLDENGQKIPVMNGEDPVLDENNDPVYEMEQKERYHYYRYTRYNEDRVYNNTETVKDSWEQAVTYTFDGAIGSHNMTDVTRNQKEKYERTLTQRRTQTDTYAVFRQDGGEVFDLTDEQKASASSVTTLPSYSENRINTVYGDYSTTKGATTYKGVTNHDFTEIAFTDGTNGTAFTFKYHVDDTQAGTLRQASGAQSAGSVKFRADTYASRSFTPTENGYTISEAQFSDFRLIVPKKNLNIQSGAEADHHITMEWSPLNLTIIGLSGVNTLTQESALSSIANVNRAVGIISDTRSTFGAYQNRFEATIRNLDNVVENTQAAESLIRDTNMAAEAVKNAKENILLQAGTAMLSQTNQSRQGILTLLQ